MYWLEVSVITDGEAAEAVAEVLRPFAYQEGVVLEQLGDMENLDPNALEPNVTVKIYLPEDRDTPALRQRLEEILYHMGRLYPIPPPTFRKLQEEDWANAWKAHYHPFRIGRRIWIQPSWLNADEQELANADLQPDDVVLTLDPGMAFGTGTHPTTQMCLQALEDIVQPGMSVLDVGTGSGILAIAAGKLGAAKLWGMDTDDVAVKTAVSNAQQNNIHHFHAWQGTLATVNERDWDVVVVNILAPVIIALLQEDGLMSYVAGNGRLILSGIIEEQAEGVETAVIAAGGQILQKLTVRDWVALIATWA
ncbi:MAG: 50S ribosomal protein L11 methyltransferase [Ardenticatenaceae bacterium]|nr:50S ribosomal protein L11 methyltransferase [Ardenticatenaceae bacterium]